ncbi:hypothetical protein [Solibacillus isronensis]|uniref:hypothetical protein n=1 Tax=Solibacillus isronensis TaxID=412383 RepID=UPI00399F1213
MIREKYIVFNNGRAVDIRPNATKSVRQTALKRIENEDEQLTDRNKRKSKI